MKKFILCLIIFSIFTLTMTTSGQNCDDEYDVPYVPTDYEIVEKMLKMANVNENDILYDLGCGDGRIVITAAKKFGTRGVGIDINPVRIEESNKNAEEEGVTEKVQFIEQNLFEADISEATVLTMYLLPSVNLKLRPILFQDLKPGTRIVSHDFDMGDWEPDQSTIIEYSLDYQNFLDNHTVYFWILPANVSGDWEVKVTESANHDTFILHINQIFQMLHGNLTDRKSNITIQDIKIEGVRLQYTTEEKNGNEKVTGFFDGTVNGNEAKGKVKFIIDTFTYERFWEAKREPSSIISFEAFN